MYIYIHIKWLFLGGDILLKDLWTFFLSSPGGVAAGV